MHAPHQNVSSARRFDWIRLGLFSNHTSDKPSSSVDCLLDFLPRLAG